MSSYPDSSAGRLRTEPGAVRRRRLRLRISRRELARRVGVDVTLIEDVEQRGTAIYDHTVSAISDQLGCDPRDLAAMPFKTTRSTDPADIQLLGALLADFGAPVHEATIAAVLGWAPERRDAAETQLRERASELTAAGIVDEHNGRLVLSTALLNALDTRHLDGLGWW